MRQRHASTLDCTAGAVPLTAAQRQLGSCTAQGFSVLLATPLQHCSTVSFRPPPRHPLLRRRMLVKDPGQRVSMPGIMSHPWFQKVGQTGLRLAPWASCVACSQPRTVCLQTGSALGVVRGMLPALYGLQPTPPACKPCWPCTCQSRSCLTGPWSPSNALIRLPAAPALCPCRTCPLACPSSTRELTQRRHRGRSGCACFGDAAHVSVMLIR